MAAIDLIVLGMVKKEPLSAYDIQKMVEYRNISRWVKISTPSIYKKVIQLADKGYIESTKKKEGNMAEKAVYSLTEDGELEFERLMMEIASQSIFIYLDFNAVIVNLDSLAPEKQKDCLRYIESSVKTLRSNLEENMEFKMNLIEIPETGKAVLKQQMALVQAIESWIETVKAGF